MKKRPSAYQSYLLRLWPAGDEGQTEWRASLDSPGTGESIAFASLEELFDFLRQQTRVSPAADAGSDRTPEAMSYRSVLSGTGGRMRYRIALR